MSDLTEIVTQHAAKRYAEALATAAGAEERIKALQEALEASERLRLDIETQLQGIDLPDDFPHIWHMGTEPPPEDVEAILSLSCGVAYRRRDAKCWVRTGLGYTSKMLHEWPIGDDGPYIALPAGYGIDALAEAVDKMALEYDRIRRELWHHDGVPEGDSPWYRPRIAEAVIGVVHTYRAKVQELEREVRRLTSELGERVTTHGDDDGD
jgi:hypothetical protein